MKDALKLIAETEAGSIHHDEHGDAWLVGLTSKGITLLFDEAEFRELVDLFRTAAGAGRETPFGDRWPAGRRFGTLAS